MLIPREGDDRTENFLARHVHVRLNAGQDGRCHQCSLTRAAGHHTGALTDGFLYPRLHSDGCVFRNQRSDHGGIVGRISGRKGFDQRKQELEKLVIRRLVDVHALDGNAGLSGIGKPTRGTALSGHVEIGVGFNDDRGIAPQFEHDAFFPSFFFQAPADRGTPRKTQGANSWIADHGFRERVFAGQHAQRSGREIEFLNHPSQPQRGQRRLRCGLEQNGIPDGQTGSHFMRDQIQRKVKRRNTQDRPDRHPSAQAQTTVHARTDIHGNDFSGYAFGFLARNRKGLNGSIHFTPGIGHGFA